MTSGVRIPVLLLAATVSLAGRSAPVSPSAAAEEEAVIVDFSTRSGSYRVTGDATLLSRRFTPGTTLEMIIAAAALETGDLIVNAKVPGRENPLILEGPPGGPGEEFFAQVLKRTGYDPVRELLLATRYTPGIPEAVASFADLARGEPLRVTVFEQNLFLQAFVRRQVPVRAEHCASLERHLAVEAPRPSWGQSGWGEISPEGPRYVSWFNGAARLKDGTHVITVAVLTGKPSSAALERFRRYLGARR